MDKGLPKRPGKTPPRLIADLIDYDPRRKSKNGRNLLADPAEWFRQDHLPPIRRGELDCKHALIRKDEQTDAPGSDDVWPDTETKYTVAAYCSHCRYHFVITADFHTPASSQVICGPGKPNPLHHLILVDSTDAEEFRAEYGEDKYNTLTEAHRWLCSSATCPLEVVIKISPPRLNKTFLSLLEDPRKVDARGRKAIIEDPERYGEMPPRTPAEVLGVLTHYLKDAEAKDPNEMKKIAVRNKRFRLCFSDDCDSLFEYLDFGRYSETSIDPETEELITDYFWKLPEVTESNKNFIQDVVFELKLRIHDRPAKERMSTFMWSPFYAARDIERSLGYYNYPTRSRIIQLDASEEHPYYAGLGATENFTDDYLGWAYDRQVCCDPDNKPYYLDCLEDLAKGRGSADLAEKFAMAKSVGAIGQKEIDEAYKSFALDQKNIEGDDHIIGVYNSRIEAAPRQKEQAKEALLVIGKARNSAKIQQVANDRTMTLEEAVEFLGVSTETSSDTIAAMAIVEAGEGTDKARIAGALRVISLSRGGDYTLEESAANMEGTKTASTLGINEAYIRLQIRDNPHALHDENVWEYYLQSTSTGNEIAREAVQVIAEYRKSAYLRAKLANPDANVHSEMASADQPVGLQNIGNTCYLNSLLQFYYTVKTVRDVVMQFEDHRMSLAEDDISKKRVGGRVVKRSEIIKAQKFVDELRNLFLNLKSATHSVTPTKQLAELTLLSTEHEEDLIKRRMSVSNPSGPPQHDPSDRPLFGPELPPPAMPSPPSLTPANSATEETRIENQSNDKNYDGDDSSEVTLVDMKDEQLDGAVVNGLGCDKELSHGHSQPNGEPEDNIGMANTTSKIIPDSPQLNGTSQPDKPPPVPPRNKAGLSIQTADIKQNNDLLTFGLQHDVTEVIGNVLFRLQCAIKPTSIDDNGGQRDAITDTFYGSNAVYTQKPEALDKKVEEWNSLIVYPPEDGSYGIYDALDVAFDQQKIESDKAITTQFASIHNLPPIVQIQINRPSFDKKTGQGYKNKCVVTFPETIYFDRYVDSDELDSGVMLRRKESWKLKAQLKRLEERLQVLEKEGVRDALAATKEYIRNLQEADEGEVPALAVESTSTLVAALEARHDEINKEIHQIHQKVSKLNKKLQEQFTDFREYEYKLQAVFVHRGETISGGHYFIFIYDFEQNLWREYNDERVDPCPNTNKIFEQEKHGGGTPYLLSYVRSADLVDALHRDVPESKPQGIRFANQVGPSGGKMLDMMSTSDYSALPSGENPETEHFENATAFLDSPETHHRAILPKPEWENNGPDRTPGGNPW